MTAPNFNVNADYAAQAYAFLAESREFLAQGRLHKASAKGWEAATHMVQAVAAAQGWRYETDDDLSLVVNQAKRLAGNSGSLGLSGIAYELRDNYYVRKRHLSAGMIGEQLAMIAEMLEILYPLTGLDGGG